MQSSAWLVWADFRVKYNLIYQVPVLCLICTHSPSDAVGPRARAYISGKALLPVLQLLLVQLIVDVSYQFVFM